MLPLLPEKHVRLNESLLGLGAIVLRVLKQRSTLDEVWEGMRAMKSSNKFIPEKITFDDLIVTIDCLFAIGVVDLDNEGKLFLCA